MNERSMKILQLLIKHPDIKVVALEKELGITRRQISYAIKQMNEALVSKHLPKIGRSHTGEFIVPSEIVQAFAATMEYTEQNPTIFKEQADFYSENERVFILLAYLAISSEIISLFHLTELLGISKNTTLADLKNAQAYIKRYRLMISYSRQEGYLLKGSELEIRTLLNDLIRRRHLFSDNQGPLSPFMTVQTDQVAHLIHLVEKKLGVSYADESFDRLIDSIRYIVTRIQNGKKPPAPFFNQHVKETTEYQVVKGILPPNWLASEDDLEWLTLIFLSSNILKNKIGELDAEDERLHGYVQQMVNQFQKQTLIEIDNRLHFEKRLLDHLRPAWFRIKYGLRLGELGLEDVIKDNNHAILMDLMNELIQPMEQELGKHFPQDELRLLSFYFGSKLSNRKEPNLPKKRAVVVCTNGMIMSKMMLENLKILFPELHFLSALSIREFQAFQRDYDLVFTTVPLNTNLPQYIMEPMMDYKQQINLRYRVLKETGLAEVDQLVETLNKILAVSVSVKDPERLKNDLRGFFVENKEKAPISNFKVLPKLTHYLKASYIQIVDQTLTWEEGVRLATAPLLADQVITQHYVETLVAETADSQNYSFLGTRMAIPHSIVESGVLKDGISLLISRTPVTYPGGQKIQIIAPIAICDYSNHLRAINQLADLGVNEEQLQSLLGLPNQLAVHNFLKQLT